MTMFSMIWVLAAYLGIAIVAVVVIGAIWELVRTRKERSSDSVERDV